MERKRELPQMVGKKSQNDSYPTKLVTTKPIGRRQRALGKKKRIDRLLRFITLVKFLGRDCMIN